MSTLPVLRFDRDGLDFLTRNACWRGLVGVIPIRAIAIVAQQTSGFEGGRYLGGLQGFLDDLAAHAGSGKSAFDLRAYEGVASMTIVGGASIKCICVLQQFLW